MSECCLKKNKIIWLSIVLMSKNQPMKNLGLFLFMEAAVYYI